MNALKLKYKTDYVVVLEGHEFHGKIVRRARWEWEGGAMLSIAKMKASMNCSYSVAFHVKGVPDNQRKVRYLSVDMVVKR